MTLLNEADAVYLGTKVVARVYRGANLVWQPEVVVNVAVAAVAPAATAAAGALVSISAAVGALAPTATAAAAVDVEEAGSGLWTPHEIEDAMYAWWDASDAASLTFSGINLLEIADQGPDNIHMGRAASSGPTAATLNGLGALAFTYDQGLMTANPTTFGDFTIHAVFNPGFSDGNTYERIVDHSYGEGWWFGRTGSTQTFGGGIMDGPGTQYGIFVPLANNEVHQISMAREGGTQTIKGNGGAVTNSRACTTAVTASNRVYMAQDNLGTSDVTDGEHGEVIIWKRALTADETAKVEGYLAWKWDIEAKLPVGHPYKSAPPMVGAPATVEIAVAATAAPATASSVVAVFHPSQLYASGELGGVWNYTDQNTLYSTSGTSTPAAVGAPIYHLTDISGKGLLLAREPTDTARPIHTLSGGGVHYALFDGVNDVMRTPLVLPLRPGVTMFFALRTVVSTAGGRSFGGLGIPTATNRLVINRSTARSEIGIRVDLLSVAQAAVQGAAGDIPINTNSVIRITINSGNITYHRNGTLLCTLVNALATGAVLYNCHFSVGDAEGGAAFNCGMFCVSYIDRFLTGTEITDYEAWLASRYAGF